MVYGLTRFQRIKVFSLVYFLHLTRFNKNFQTFKVNRNLDKSFIIFGSLANFLSVMNGGPKPLCQLINGIYVVTC